MRARRLMPAARSTAAHIQPLGATHRKLGNRKRKNLLNRLDTATQAEREALLLAMVNRLVLLDRYRRSAKWPSVTRPVIENPHLI